MDWMEPETEFPSNRWGRWVLILIVALGLHFFLGRLPSEFADFLNAPATSPEIELTKIPEKFVDSKNPVVETSKAREQVEKNQTPRFAGEFRNRVEKETQARNGQFRQGGKPSAPEKLSKDGDRSPGPSIKDLMPFSTTPNGLPNDVAPGDQTVLNTEPVLYASFFNRILNEIYGPWTRHVREVLEHVAKLNADSFTTVLQIEMNKAGEITSISVLKGSGMRDLDKACETAFWETQPFRNPPPQLLQQDGFVRFNYQFTVETGGSGLRILPFNI